MPTLFETNDVDAAYDYMCGLYGRLHFSVSDGPPHFRIAEHRLGHVRLHHDLFRMRFEVDGPRLGVLGFGRLVGGVASYGVGRRERTYARAGEVFLVAQPEMPYRGVFTDCAVDLAILDPVLLTQVADEAPGRTGRPVRFTGYQPVTPAAAIWWTSAYDYVHRHLAISPAADEPLVAGTAGRLLMASALASFPHDGLDGPTIEDRRDAHPAALRRALAFIDGNADRDISPADIAGAARVTIRSLQLTFRRHLDTTPTAHLRRVRLELAHRELQAAAPNTVTIAAIAARWGFGSHSRFTAHYRATFGRPPSTTLQRE